MRGQQQYCNGNIKIRNTSIKSITTAAATFMVGSLTWILHVNHLEVELLKELLEVVIIRLGALKRHELKSSRKAPPNSTQTSLKSITSLTYFSISTMRARPRGRLFKKRIVN